MLFEIGCEMFSQGAVFLKNRILGCDLASLERVGNYELCKEHFLKLRNGLQHLT